MQLGLYLKVPPKNPGNAIQNARPPLSAFLETKSRLQFSVPIFISLKNKYAGSSLDLVSKNCAGRSYNIGSTQDLVGQRFV